MFFPLAADLSTTFRMLTNINTENKVYSSHVTDYTYNQGRNLLYLIAVVCGKASELAEKFHPVEGKLLCAGMCSTFCLPQQKPQSQQ